MSQFPPPVVGPPPPPPPYHGGVPDPANAVTADVRSGSISLTTVALLALGVSVVCWAVWFALDDTLAHADFDTAVVWVPMVTLGVAGVGWAAASPGRGRPARVGAAAMVGAASGAAGALIAGRAKTHFNAASDGAITSPHIVTWAALGAAAWAITLGVATSPGRRRATVIGAAAGGAASGGVMGALLGHFNQGNPPKVVPTDFWWSLPLDTAEVGVRVIPILLVGIAVPMLCAHPARIGASLGRAAAVLAVLVVGGVVLVHGDSNSLLAAPVSSTGETRNPDSPVETATPGPTPAVSLPEVTAPPDTLPPITAAPITAASIPPVTEPPSQPLPFPFDPGFDVSVVYNGTAANDAGETAPLDIALGAPYVASSDLPTSTGNLVCPLGPNDAVFPFAVSLSARGLDLTTSVRVSFGQGGVEGADAATYPLSVQWDYAGGRQCLPGTTVATDAAAAGSTWATLQADEPQSGAGYLVVSNYFDSSGQAIGGPSAGTGVGIVIDEQPTHSEWQLTGGAVGTVHDPTYGDYGAVLFG